MEASSAEHVLNGHEDSADPPHLIYVKPQLLEQAWPVLEPLLAQACAESHGEFTLGMIAANFAHWPILAIARNDRLQAAMVTRVAQRADGSRVLDCLMASGDHSAEWPLVDDEFDEFARGFGCVAVRIPRARDGWLKRLPHWRVVGVWLWPRDKHAQNFGPICVPHECWVSVRRSLRWKQRGYLLEREI